MQPKFCKYLVSLLNSFTRKQNVHVGKLEFLTRIKVFAANIPSTCYGHDSISNNKFIMHTLIDIFHAKKIVQYPQMPVFVRIKYFNFKIWMQTEYF